MSSPAATKHLVVDVFFACSLAALARAQTPCGSPVGPDLIAANIGAAVNYSPTGGIDAAMFGLTECNLGTQLVQHSASTSQHPVFVEGLFRYEVVGGAGRFEQIGMSWVFHETSALEQSLCCTCSPSGFPNLGPGCSSSSTATIVGTQTSLGTRYAVNAFTGTFGWPIMAPGIVTPVARRLQFALGDVDPSVHGGASYFVELAAIAADDAAPLHGPNNASYRSVSVSGTSADVTLAPTASTVREQAAVLAWKAIDPTVEIQVAQVPNEGIFLVGSQATSLGGGLWRYEYAVENVNSDVSCSAFSVPVPPGVHAFAMGFHDVSYHDNDGPGGMAIDGTDWSPAFVPGSASWSTPNELSNPLSNGLRFATLYNFRFDAFAPPQMGSVTLDQWRGIGSVQAVARVPATPPSPGIAYCFGDGSGAACPCGNASTVGAQEGCLNSFGLGGKLQTTGLSSVAGDTLVLAGSQMSDAPALYFQGTTQTGGGAGAPFGDGLRCASGATVRLGTKTSSGGASQYPGVGDASVSVRGGCGAGDLRTYQIWYRNAASFCTVGTYNLTNGAQVVWSF